MTKLDNPQMAIAKDPKELARKLITTKPEDYVVGNASKAGLRKFSSKHTIVRTDAPNDSEENNDAVFTGSKQSKEKTTRRADYTIDQSQAAYESVDLESDSNAQKEDAIKNAPPKFDIMGLIKDIKSKKHTKKETEGTDTTEPHGEIKIALPKNVTEATDEMSDAAHELVLHADNDHHLYRNSHVPVAKNLEKKFKKGTYDHKLAGKLWSYHADRAAQSYAKQHGDVKTPWHKMFTTADRKQAAAHMADAHKAEMEAGNFHEGAEWNDIPALTEEFIAELGEPMTQAPATSDNPGGADTAPVSAGKKDSDPDNKDETDDSSMSDQAKDDLEHIALVAAEAYEYLSAEDKDLPDWIQEKLTLAKDFLESVHEFIEEDSDEDEDEPEGNQGGEAGKPGSDETNTQKPTAYKEEVEQDPTHIVHFRKGTTVGARRHRSIYVTAKDENDAVTKAKKEWPTSGKEGYKVSDVHTFSEEVEQVNEAKLQFLTRDQMRELPTKKLKQHLARHGAAAEYASGDPDPDRPFYWKHTDQANRADRELRRREKAKSSMKNEEVELDETALGKALVTGEDGVHKIAPGKDKYGNKTNPKTIAARLAKGAMMNIKKKEV